MSTYWERFAGDTSELAIRMTLEHDPDEGLAASPEESASWGSIELWVGGRNIFAHSESGHRTPAVHWYLLSVLEWLAGIWDPLLHEERLPIANLADDAAHALQITQFPPDALTEAQARERETQWASWSQRHSLISARDGGMFPNLVLRRWRDRVELSWDSTAWTAASHSYAFDVPVGTARVGPNTLAADTHAIVTEAANLIQSKTPSSERVGSLVAQLDQLNSTRRNELRSALVAGLNPNGAEPFAHWQALIGRVQLRNSHAMDAILGCESTELVITKAPVLALLLGAMRPDIGDTDVDSVVGFLANAAGGEDPPLVRELAVDEPPVRSAAMPYQQGYQLADRLRVALGLSDDEPTDIQSLLLRLGIGLGEVHLDDRRVRAISIAGEGFSPAIALNSNYLWKGRRGVDSFTMAHELCHVLFDRGLGGVSALGSGTWAPKALEQRAGAFAAMFLMPLGYVQALVRENPWSLPTLDGIGWLATKLGTSMTATLQHVGNLGFVDETDRELLAEELATS